MEFSLCSLDGALPVEIIIDEDNGRYMIRKSDTSGEFFNSPMELINWVRENFREDEFCYPEEFRGVLTQLREYELNPNMF